jgi:hypothetical protein
MTTTNGMWAPEVDETWGELPESSLYTPEGEGEGWGETGTYEQEAWGEAGAYEQEGWGELPEGSWEGEGEGWGETGTYEQEQDQFFPLIALAAKALPAIGKLVAPAIKSLIPAAKKAVGGVVQSVLGGGGRRGPRRPPRRMPRPPMAAPAAPMAAPAGRPLGRPFRPARRATVSSLLARLSRMLGEGEQIAAETEAQFFGVNEFQGELAANENAHEAALTEVLAAEAAHTESESEAQALLGSALPITIRIMGGHEPLRRVYPALARANARMVRGIRRSGPAGPQLLRLSPSIQRRTVASLLAAQRAGRRVTPQMVAPVMAGQAARVLGTPHICGRALVRNTTIRQGTVAPSGRRVRRRPAGA